MVRLAASGRGGRECFVTAIDDPPALIRQVVVGKVNGADRGPEVRLATGCQEQGCDDELESNVSFTADTSPAMDGTAGRLRPIRVEPAERVASEKGAVEQLGEVTHVVHERLTPASRRLVLPLLSTV